MPDRYRKEVMRLVIIGGVAGGATAAARARRISEKAEITIIERGPYVSFANCGLPYFLSGDIQKRSRLLLQTPEGFDSRYAVKVLVETEAVGIDRASRQVRVKGPDGEADISYDKLILAQGGRPVVPRWREVEAPNVFTIWTIPDMDRIQQFITEKKPESAVIAGGGFIGLEMAEAFAKRGLAVSIVEMMPRLMPMLDPEMGSLIAEQLEKHGVRVLDRQGHQGSSLVVPGSGACRRDARARRPCPPCRGGRRRSLLPARRAWLWETPAASLSMTRCGHRTLTSLPSVTWRRLPTGSSGAAREFPWRGRQTARAAWRPPTRWAFPCATRERSAPAS